MTLRTDRQFSERRDGGFVTDVLALTLKLAKTLDLIDQEHRSTVLQLLRDRYRLGPVSGAARMRQSRERWDGVALSDDGHATNVTEQTQLSGVNAPASRAFEVPASVLEALSKAKVLGAAARLRAPEYWQAEVRANQGVDYAAQILKAEAWIVANPERAPRKNYAAFMHRWLGRATTRGEE